MLNAHKINQATKKAWDRKVQKETRGHIKCIAKQIKFTLRHTPQYYVNYHISYDDNLLESKVHKAVALHFEELGYDVKRQYRELIISWLDK